MGTSLTMAYSSVMSRDYKKLFHLLGSQRLNFTGTGSDKFGGNELERGSEKKESLVKALVWGN